MSELATAFARYNPQLSDGPAPPPPEPAAHILANPSAMFRGRADVPADAVRVVQAGGALTQLLMHPTFTPLEQLFRRLPEGGMFSASPDKPFKFELGAFQVPAQMAFAFIDYRFDIYRLGGAVPGDFMPIEERRLSTQVAYDVNISEYRKGNLRYELDPVPIQTTKEAFTGAPQGGIIAGRPAVPGITALSNAALPTATGNQFNLAAFANSTSIGGPGLSSLPQRTQRQGPLPLPFTYIVRSNQRVQFSGIVWKAIPIPIAFFEVDVTGILMPSSVLDDMIKGMNPSTGAGGGR